MKENIQYRYKSTSEALEELKAQGYTVDYNLNKEQITANPEQFDITYIYRYEGNSNPDDESTVYGIIKENTQEKGVYVVGNLSTSDDVDQFLVNLEIKRRNE